MFKRKYIRAVVINGVVSLAVVIVLWIVSSTLSKMALSEDLRLSELNTALSSAGELKANLENQRQTIRVLQSQLENYRDNPIDKDIFLKELSAVTNNVEVVRFSEIPTEESSDFQSEPADHEIEGLLETKKFGLILYGSNSALYESLLNIKALRINHRIRDTLWRSDYASDLLPKISDRITLIEALSDPKFTNAYKSSLMDFTENSMLSFTIEFFCPDFSIIETGSVG